MKTIYKSKIFSCIDTKSIERAEKEKERLQEIYNSVTIETVGLYGVQIIASN